LSSLNLAYRSLRRRRTRTILTVSGIVTGVALILVLFSLTAGASAQTGGLIRNLSPAQITVTNSTRPSLPGGAGSEGFPGGSGGLPGGSGSGGGGFRDFFGTSSTLSQSLEGQIGNITGVYATASQLSVTGYVGGSNAFIYGIEPATYTEVTGGLTIVSGSALSSTSTANDVVLGQTLAQNLNAVVGSTVTIGQNSTGGDSFTVVGIYSAGNPFEDSSAYVPLSSAQNLSNDSGKVTDIYVKADSASYISTIASEINSAIPGVSAITASTFAATATSLSGTLATFFTVIGLVALLAGGFGVINTMIMSTTERTREIGTLRAIGARRRQVMQLFLGEAFLIGVIGGIGGVVVGAIVSLVLPSFTGAASSSGFGGRGVGGLFGGALRSTLTPEIILLSLGLGVVVGVLAGIYPAWRASRLDPVESLRHV
jgi:putative ABC transport system permease protein